MDHAWLTAVCYTELDVKQQKLFVVWHPHADSDITHKYKFAMQFKKTCTWFSM